MSANFQRIAVDLGRQLQTRFPSLEKSTGDDKPIDGVKFKNEDARKFTFDFVDESGEKIVNVTVSLNEKDDGAGGPGLDVTWNEQVQNRSWDRFIRSILPKFAQTHGLNFNAQNPSQSNLVKRHSFEESNMNESKLFGTSKTSYQEIGEAKIIVRHTQPINLNAPNGRTQHIENIYVENSIGERFRYPIKHLNGARAMARHIAEGGSFFDDIGNYIIGLSEELSKLRIFKNYVDRSPVISENMGNIQTKVIDRIGNIKEEIHSLQLREHYAQFKENFSVAITNEVPEDILNDWIVRLTVRSFNEDLKDAFPYIYKLVDETEMIIRMGFAGYFLIVSDFIRYAKEKNIPVGPGRGSGAGSLVAYAMDITNINPLPFNLLFERFINPERVSLPDFDVDFCQDRRGEVIEYVTKKYGQERVGQIITFGKLQAKAVIRDVSRVFGLPYSEADVISKLIPEELGITLEKAIELEPKLMELIDSDQKIRKIVDISKRLEGLLRHASIHAAGVIITNEPLVTYAPLYRGRDGEQVVQFDKDFSEKIGLVKFDFLGLKTLTVIQNAVNFIRRDIDPHFDIENIDMEDRKVFDLISSGNTSGVFQLESSGMKELCKRIKPDTLDDITAINALYRPGPLFRNG